MARMYYQWKPYVPVADRRRNAERALAKLRKQGRAIEPIEIEGRTIARTFWGRGWCDNLEHYSDYANRLPRGRTYARNGSVVHLAIEPGKVSAIVSGRSIYNVDITVSPLAEARWQAISRECAGRIDSLIDLLAGQLADGVMQVLAQPRTGLFPTPREIELGCSCPDWAGMCKHVAAALYGVGARLDQAPELLFRLRQVDAMDLIAKAATAEQLAELGGAGDGDDALAGEDLGALFGIDLDLDGDFDVADAEVPSKREPKQRAKNGKATTKTAKTAPKATMKVKAKPTTTTKTTKTKTTRTNTANAKTTPGSKAKTKKPTSAATTAKAKAAPAPRGKGRTSRSKASRGHRSRR